MEFNKTVTNPILVGILEVLKEEDSPEHRKLFLDELSEAKLMLPADIMPPPEIDADGRMHLAQGCRVGFPQLKAPDGKQFYLAFTDQMEMKKWKNEDSVPFFAVKLEDYAGMLFGQDSNGNASPANGFVINPFGNNIVVPKELVAIVMAKKYPNGGGMPS